MLVLVPTAAFCRTSASASSACSAATTSVEPPLRPRITIHGTSVSPAIRSFDSAAETKPTGMPTTSAGRTPSSRINRTSSINAVGALPMPTMAPSSNPRRCALRMACTARVVSSAWAWAITSASLMNWCGAMPKCARRGRDRPEQIISTSATTGVPPRSIAAMPASTASGWKSVSPLNSKSALAWTMRRTIGHCVSV